jgi:MoaA/NifB/PqqE/SkfB family radical SAM enzyme
MLSGIFRGAVLKQNVLRYLELQVNAVCNQRCEGCFATKARAPGRQPLSPEEIAKLWQDLKKLGAIQGIITGGEPTMRKDLFEVFEALETRKSMFAMTTNGLLLTRQYLGRLKEIGLVYLAVSLNSLDADENDRSRGSPGHFNQVMDVLSWAKEVKLPVGLSTILSHLNLDEFERMAAFCQANGIQIVPAFAVAQGRWTGRGDVRLTREDYERLDRINEKYPVVRSELTNNYCGRKTCPGGTEKLFVTVYGDVTTCQLNPVSYGNIRLEPIERIWQRILKVESFAKINPICVVSSDEVYVRDYIDPIAQATTLPVPIEQHPVMKDKFPDLPPPHARVDPPVSRSVSAVPLPVLSGAGLANAEDRPLVSLPVLNGAGLSAPEEETVGACNTDSPETALHAAAQYASLETLRAGS